MNDSLNLKGDMDWVDCIIFLMYAQAHTTDWDLTKNEGKVINDKSDNLVSTLASWEEISYSKEDVKDKMAKVFDYYSKSLAKGEDQIGYDMTFCVNHIKNLSWFNPKFAQTLVNWFTELAEADGVNENEKFNLKKLAEDFGAESPF